ncbi:hypothetical protein [Roseateles sp.]|uniref:hypothetical protein n=1 Tax=Roseateles sp. TaxID=1971397 RepID=UPI002F3F92F0
MIRPADPALMKDKELIELVDAAIDGFHGNLNDLGSAIGMLMLSRRYGWKVMLLTHSPGTIRKYLKILGLKHLREAAPELGELSRRSNAWRLVEDTSNFWKVVRGQIGGVRSAIADPALGAASARTPDAMPDTTTEPGVDKHKT